MRLLQVVTDDDRRGAQVFARDLGRRLTEADVDVRTVALAPGASGGLDVEVLGRGPWLRNLGALRRLMRDADVVIAHGSTTLPACALAGIGSGRPLVYRQVSDPAYWTPTLPRRVRTAVWYRRVARVVALSPSIADVLCRRFRIPRARITVIPNAVEERRWPAATARDGATARRGFGLPPAPAAVIAVVGSLTVEKGISDLVAAAESSTWHLLVVGEGPERAGLEAHAARVGVAVTFTGGLDDPWPAVAAADVVALPSRSDMHPAVVIEAALTGTPVVATDVGAVRDLVLDGVTGRVVPAGSGTALRDALADLLERPDERTAISRRARAHALEHHSLTSIAPRWLELLSEVTEAR